MYINKVYYMFLIKLISSGGTWVADRAIVHKKVNIILEGMARLNGGAAGIHWQGLDFSLMSGM